MTPKYNCNSEYMFIKFLKAHTVFLPVAVDFLTYTSWCMKLHTVIFQCLENECTFQPQGANKNDCSLKKKMGVNLHVVSNGQKGLLLFLIDFLDKLDDLLWKTLFCYGANLPARQMIGMISDWIVLMSQ